MSFKVGQIVKSKSDPRTLYSVQYLIAHPSASAPTAVTDVYACVRLSAYDGMPMGGTVFIAENEIE